MCMNIIYVYEYRYVASMFSVSKKDRNVDFQYHYQVFDNFFTRYSVNEIEKPSLQYVVGISTKDPYTQQGSSVKIGSEQRQSHDNQVYTSI